MVYPLVECVPNFSEGRSQVLIDEIKTVISAIEGAFILDTHMDADHNRSVVTFVGHPYDKKSFSINKLKQSHRGTS